MARGKQTRHKALRRDGERRRGKVRGGKAGLARMTKLGGMKGIRGTR